MLTKTLTSTTVGLLCAGAAIFGQQLTPRLARVSVVEREGRPPVLEVVANAPLAFKLLGQGEVTEIQIFGVELGAVPAEQLTPLGRVELSRADNGNLLLRITPVTAIEFQVRSAARPNVLEISAREP